MGEGKKKKQRFLAMHPWCCFCGGNTSATSIDHIPARTCFRGRNFPETFEFPACDACNGASRIDEIAFSFFVKMLDHSGDDIDGSEATKTIDGMVNNLPHLLPMPSSDGRRNRQMLQRMGLNKPLDMLSSNLPMLSISDEASEHIKRYARKIACALYYREQGRPASADHQMIAHWGQAIDRSFMEGVDGFLAMPFLQVGTRTNVEFGNQFAYRHIEAKVPDVFGMIAQFGTGLVICAMVVTREIAGRLLADTREMGVLAPEPWTAVRDNYPGIAPDARVDRSDGSPTSDR